MRRKVSGTALLEYVVLIFIFIIIAIKTTSVIMTFLSPSTANELVESSQLNTDKSSATYKVVDGKVVRKDGKPLSQKENIIFSNYNKSNDEE